MTTVHILTLIGLSLITIGGIGAARSTPAPHYNADGSVSLTSEPNRLRRIEMSRRQRHLPYYLFAVGFGALLQALAVGVDALS